jgi:hypothetical protein
MVTGRSLTLVATAALALATSPAVADVWMVKSSGAVGCRDRPALVKGAQESGFGCVLLVAGERLLDMAEVGVGFSNHLRVQRHDGSILYVATDAITADLGIGTLSEDRSD